MGLITRAKAAWSAFKTEPLGIGWGLASWQFGQPYSPSIDHNSLIEKYKGWVYACANLNAVNCAQVPLRLYTFGASNSPKVIHHHKKLDNWQTKALLENPSLQNIKAARGAEEIIEILDHPLLDLLAKVNPYMNQFDLFELTELYLELTGNAYWQLVGVSEEAAPVEIWPLPAQRIKIIPSKRMMIEAYEFNISGSEKIKIPAEEVIHFKFPNPKDSFCGMGPLEACVVAADLSEDMNILEASIMKNRGVIDQALILPSEAGTPGEEERKRLREEWQKLYGGPRRGGKLAIISGGADLKNVQLSPKDLNYLQGRRFTKEEIASAFGVPISKLQSEDVNRANAEAGDYQYAKNTIRPRLRKLEQKLNERLCPLFDESLFVVFDDPVAEDKEYRLNEINSHLQSGYSVINEERQQDGLEEVDWGNTPIMPITMAPVGTPAPAPTIPAKPEPEQEKQFKATRRFPPLNHPTNFVNEQFETALRDYYRSMKKELLTLFDANYKRQKILLDDWMSSWFDVQKWNKRLLSLTDPFIRFTLMAGGERSLLALMSRRGFDTNHTLIFSALEKHRIGTVQNINGTKVRQLRHSLAEGMDEGEGLYELRRRVVGVFDNAERFEAERIARTETIWAWNEGAVQGYIQSGVVVRKEWLSSGDARSCEYCLALNGMIVEVEANFFEKGTTFQSPIMPNQELSFSYGDISHPPLHPNCRCCIVPVLE